ncbi:MAG: sterol desaturase family protein [Bacteroidia bacterium]|nr:sterol desaturase family protein [Bacteroidia bacterium]
MEAFIDYFESMPTWQKLAWIIICLSFNWIGEAVKPLFNFDYKKFRHIGVNLVFLAMDMTINILFGLATVGVFLWIGENNIGILNMISLPVWVELIVSVMVLDLVAQYLAHYLLHRVPWMWRLHMIHHSDTHVDATTATRFHPGDYVMREIFALMAIVIAGIPLAFYIFYRILTIFFTYFTHANARLPKWLDRGLSYIFVTPDMHKFHHHFERPWTDTNFGNIFSIWDRMFGTMVYQDTKDIKYGLDVLDGSKDENILFQLGIPFNKEIKTDPDKGNWW